MIRSIPIPGGVFVAVVGPSGSGKDSVMRLANERLEREAPGRVHFARRIITREADGGAETHETCSAERFAALRADRGFALSWTAHGCAYGIPAAADDLVAAGTIVVANLSRAVLPDMRARYARSLAIAITAPLPVLAARIATRGRESGPEVEARLARSERFCAPAIPYDLVIDNSGPLETSVCCFLDRLKPLLSDPARRATAV